MYAKVKYRKSQLTSTIKLEGESIEQKVERLVSNKEPIKDGAPLIYTARKDGVQEGYNIRTDKWEVATNAMDIVTKNRIAQREEKGKVIDLKDKGNNGTVDNVEPTQGT